MKATNSEVLATLLVSAQPSVVISISSKFSVMLHLLVIFASNSFSILPVSENVVILAKAMLSKSTFVYKWA